MSDLHRILILIIFAALGIFVIAVLVSDRSTKRDRERYTPPPLRTFKSYEFKPQPDITALELAALVSHGANGRIVYIYDDEYEWLLSEIGTGMRHLVRVDA